MKDRLLFRSRSGFLAIFLTLYCLRFLGIYKKEECAEKLRWLLGRLLLLLAEDGRKPTTIKVVKLTYVRFCEDCSPCRIFQYNKDNFLFQF